VAWNDIRGYDSAEFPDNEDVMKKFFYGLIVGAIIAFPLGINFGKDKPLLSNPLAAKPNLPEKVKEKAEEAIQGTKEAIHEATKPVKENLKK
jgi:hypothetical protein